jgi:hypothetical protein
VFFFQLLQQLKPAAFVVKLVHLEVGKRLMLQQKSAVETTFFSQSGVAISCIHEKISVSSSDFDHFSM